MSITFERARDAYRAESNIRSTHTLQSYLRAIDLFFTFLEDRSFHRRLPIHEQLKTSAAELEVSALGNHDTTILEYFAEWMQTPKESDPKRPYAYATIELRLAGVQHWLDYVEKKGWFAADFSLMSAIEHVKAYLQKPKDLPSPQVNSDLMQHDLTRLFTYYPNQKPSKKIQNNPLQLARWELNRLRNDAFLQTLAETGGQVSAIVNLNVADFDLSKHPLEIPILGKNEYTYMIVLTAAIAPVRQYLAKRTIGHTQEPLFVSHDPNYEGQRMSRVIAWRIIQRAAKAVGLPEISPHDLRHWRAKQLIQAGLTPEQLQAYLGHRTLSTIYAYYGDWFGDEAEDFPSSAR